MEDAERKFHAAVGVIQNLPKDGKSFVNPDPIGAASVCGSGLDLTLFTQKYSVADPGSGAFLTRDPE
jgi:hypothetical protein